MHNDFSIEDDNPESTITFARCWVNNQPNTFAPIETRLNLLHLLPFSNRRLSLDSRSQASPFTPSEMLSVVGSEIKKTLKPKVKTMSEKDLTKRHLNCFTRNNGNF